MKPTKCAFVTGGSRGIGSGVVKVLAREGYDIAFTYHSAEEEAKEMSEYVKGLGRRWFYYQASLEERDVPTRVTRQAIQDLGRLDVLVNNAGVTRHNLVTEMDADFIDFVYGVDFRNYILCTGEAARHTCGRAEHYGRRVAQNNPSLHERVGRAHAGKRDSEDLPQNSFANR